MNSYAGEFGDKRLAKRGSLLEASLISTQSCVLNQLGKHRKEAVGYGRFLSNPKVDECGLINGICNRLNPLVSGKSVLSLQDTTELHYHRHSKRIIDKRGLGDAGRSELGYFFHPSLVVSTDGELVYGLSDIDVYHRPWDRTSSASRKQRAIEDKESYKWLRAVQASKERLSQAASVTFVQDRDGDIYESFARIADERNHLLVRSRTDRNTELGKMYEEVNEQACTVVYELEINGANRKRQKRKAKLELRFKRVQIVRPASLKASYPSSLSICVVQVKEQAQSVPEGEEPIEWTLLTTHEVCDFMDAMQIVFWYTLRWLIEELFRLLKKKGFQLEDSELESGLALRKLGIMTLQAATQIMQMRQARQAEQEQDIELVFDKEEQECLQSLLPDLQGSTQALQNPYQAADLRWAVWIVARLGGWKGYQSQRPPGVITLTKGMERFQIYLWAWKNSKHNIEYT